ncbi:pickpocket protein 28-like [Chironomus tepperi]|uniref:pickpocket protein 28-like n=1 Tax=Chironomus tepperi TaxID=113505 RepID=UPI00391F2317
MYKCYFQEYVKFDDQECKCYPPCNDISYDYVYQKVSSDSSGSMKKLEVVAKFKQDSFYPQIRRKYFTMIDWFSFVGGILGLFFGFSFLSAFEIIFHVLQGLAGLIINCRKQQSNRHQVDGAELKTSRKVFEYFRKFMTESSIHGFNYIFGDDMKIYERIAWMTSFIISITACGFMIQELKDKLAIDAVSLVSQNDFINITEIPFPAITIMRIFNIERNPESHDDTVNNSRNKFVYDEEDFEAGKVLMSHHTDFGSQGRSLDEISGVGNYGHKIPIIAKRIYGIKSPKNVHVIWNDQYKVPTAEVLNHRIIGQTFNLISNDEMFTNLISDDFRYISEQRFRGGERNKSFRYPLSPSYANHEYLSINYLHAIDGDEFIVDIHSPFDYPMQISEDQMNTFYLNLPRTLDILIIPEILKTTDNTKQIPLSQRMCYMENERKLKFFKTYTQRNCQLECLSDKIRESCDCVPFNIVRDKKTLVCEHYDYKCINLVKTKHINDENSCNCLQSCNLISYKLETIETTNRRSKDGEIHVKFKDNEFVYMQRVQQFTIFDFLSYIGGLLGLFAGISVLSIFEIFYFFTLRLICEFLRFKKGRMRVECGQIDNTVTPSAVE